MRAILMLIGLLATAGVVMAVGVGQLRCEYATNPLGIGEAQPRLSWAMSGEGRGLRQTSYQVLVASSMKKLDAEQGDLWNSGRVISDQSTQVVYAGPALQSRQCCYWKVRVWDQQPHATPYSAPACWEMGLLRPEDFRARFIELLPPDDPLQALRGATWIWYPEVGNPMERAPVADRFFRKMIVIPPGAQIVQASFRLAVDDAYVLYVNGVKVDEKHEDNGWRSAKTVDLTARLAPGANVLAIKATNFQWAAGLVGKLLIRLAGEPPQVICTDRSWLCSKTAEDGWELSAFADKTWQAARELTPFGDGPWSWVNETSHGPAPYLRKTFILSKPVRRARLYATALGLYECHLNGWRVGDQQLAPGDADYDKRLYYQTYDVTALLRHGDNVLGAILGDGWYCGHMGLVGHNVYGDRPALCCQLVIDFADGSSRTIITDDSWQGREGPIRLNDLLDGEEYDARQEMTGWDTTPFADAGWHKVDEREEQRLLQAQVGPPVRVISELKTRTVSEPTKGAFVFDLGQNMVGWVRLRVQGPAGTKVTLRFAEMLNPDGTVYTANLRGARCIDTYTLKGGDAESWEPRFTFHGFRYVELTGYPGTPTCAAITGRVVSSDTPTTGVLTCADPMLTQLQSNIRWGQRGNYLSIPTDCPQRDERLGWMGDAQVFIRTAAFNCDIAGFFTKWLLDVDDAQTPEGAFADISPHVTDGDGTAAWADAGVICPWTVYCAYGDRRILEQHYPAMARYVNYCQAQSNACIREGGGSNYGDWLSTEGTPIAVLSTAYFAYSTELTAQAARVLGKEKDAQHYAALYADIVRAFNKRFVREDARIDGNSQTCYLLALRFNLLPEEKRAAAADHLIERIKARDWHLSTGFVGVSYLLPVLTQTGHADIAYRLLRTDTYPSWLFSVKHGATTIWERWDGWTPERGFQSAGMNSFNHYSLGSCGQWMYESMGGIAWDPAQPGYKHIIIHPEINTDIKSARAEYASQYGKIVSGWTVKDKRVTLQVTIPPNTTATVYLPATDQAAVKESGRPISSAAGVTFERVEGNTLVYAVASGVYTFTMTTR
jgi:alpha-L-rhamnosidase